MDVMGKLRKLLVTGGKIGIFDVIDRTNGAYVASTDLGLENVVAAIDPKSGEKQLAPLAVPNANKTKMVCPDSGGVRSWPSTAIDPTAHLLFVPATESCMKYTWHPRDAASTAKGGVDIKWVLEPRPDSDGKFGRLEAIDLTTGKVAWTDRRRAPETSAVLATAGGLVFDGSRDREFRASDSSTGDMLWQTRLCAVFDADRLRRTRQGICCRDRRRRRRA